MVSKEVNNPTRSELITDFVKGISRLKVVQAKSIMQSIEKFENQNGKLSNDLEVVNEGDLLSKLIETSASKDKPVIVHNSQNQVAVSYTHLTLPTTD